MSAAHIILAVCGGVAEFIGFSLVLWESNRLRYKELGRVGSIRNLWQIAIETIRNPAPAELRGASAGARSSATATIEVTPGTHDPLELLRRRVSELEGRVTATQAALDSHTGAMRGQMAELAATLDKRMADLRETRRSDLARAISNERRGAYIFLFGVACNLAANLVR